eukprot:CAMPEP_0174948432 /NCGR_PEP_ID=MMETSP1355-20121228/89026_1 /TAXON_ID=464990 /ORGANISM="Hemiselmis tepida, Strain CCMP443" /LENGTH=512 /DNA_ID=CAMNT_0016195943 /DNA_START=225 /DNA_END=1760 /DNA_ORIENTATION=-
MAHLGALARSASRKRLDSISSLTSLSHESQEVNKVKTQAEEQLVRMGMADVVLPEAPKPPPGYEEDPDKEERKRLQADIESHRADKRELSGWYQLVTSLWDFLEDPNSSSLALAWALIVMGLIALSCACFVIETLPDLCCGRYDHIWGPIEDVCIATFTFEYLARFLICPVEYGAGDDLALLAEACAVLAQDGGPSWKEHLRVRWRYVWQPLNLVDVVAIAPYYIDQALAGAGGDLQFVRVIRLARVFRLFKLGKYSGGLQILGRTMAKSSKDLLMMCGMLAIVIVLYSTFMYYFERGRFCGPSNGFCDGSAPLGTGWYANPFEYTLSHFEHEECGLTWCRDLSDFQSIFISGYWTLTTMTTTGYGSEYPQTAPAMVLGSLIMFSGLLLLALPITIISGNFIHIYHNDLYKKRLAQWQEDVALATNPDSPAARRRRTSWFANPFKFGRQGSVSTLSSSVEEEEEGPKGNGSPVDKSDKKRNSSLFAPMARMLGGSPRTPKTPQGLEGPSLAQ